MRTTFYLGLGLLLLLRAGFAESKSSAGGGPQISFAEQTYDFVKVKGGEVVKHSFVFTNTGSATLEILQVKPGCGCTTAGDWDKTVEPGKTGSIPLQFNSSGFGGKVTKFANVTCNDAAHSNIVLQITGTVWKPLDVSPTMAVFNMPPEGQTNETRSIRITSNVEEPVTLSELVCSNQSFRAELVTIRPGKEFELKVTAIPPFNSPFMSTPIKIKTSAKEMPEINTTAYVTVLPAVSVMPSQVMLPAGPLTSEMHPIVTVRANTTNQLSLSDATLNAPGASVVLKEAQPGRAYNLTLNLPAGFQVQPGQKMEVSVKSNNPKVPEIKIPIIQVQNVASQPVPSTAKLSPAAGPVTAH